MFSCLQTKYTLLCKQTRRFSLCFSCDVTRVPQKIKFSISLDVQLYPILCQAPTGELLLREQTTDAVEHKPSLDSVRFTLEHTPNTTPRFCNGILNTTWYQNTTLWNNGKFVSLSLFRWHYSILNSQFCSTQVSESISNSKDRNNFERTTSNSVASKYSRTRGEQTPMVG